MSTGENSEDKSLAERQRLLAQREAERRPGAPPASHDRVTGLPGRMFFDDHVELALLRAQARGRLVAVAWLALDGLDPVRELYGAAAADACVAEIARRLRTRLRPTDYLARSEPLFGLMFEDLEQPDTARTMAQALLQAVRAPFDLRPSPDAAPVRVGMNATLGIALYPLHGDTRAVLLERAGAALQAARSAGGGVRVHA